MPPTTGVTAPVPRQLASTDHQLGSPSLPAGIAVQSQAGRALTQGHIQQHHEREATHCAPVARSVFSPAAADDTVSSRIAQKQHLKTVALSLIS